MTTVSSFWSTPPTRASVVALLSACVALIVPPGVGRCGPSHVLAKRSTPEPRGDGLSGPESLSRHSVRTTRQHRQEIMDLCVATLGADLPRTSASGTRADTTA